MGIKRHNPDQLLRNLLSGNREISYGWDVYSESSHPVAQYQKNRNKKRMAVSLEDIGKCVGVLIASTGIGMLFEYRDFAEANIIAACLLGVLITAVITRNRAYSLIASIASVLDYNFFFAEPKYSFAANDVDYWITFFLMFLMALISSSLAVKLKVSAEQSAQAAYRTKVLFDTNLLLQQAKGIDEIITATADQLVKLLGREAVVYLPEDGKLGQPHWFPVGGQIGDKGVSQGEREAAEWAFQNKQQAGAMTDHLPQARCLYSAICVNDTVYCVVGIAIGGHPLDDFENSILLSILGECALVIEGEKNAREKEEAAILARNEQLRANLLRAISHDLRTPLTSISGNASNLKSNWKQFPEETVVQLCTDIYDDSLWLINLVENLLSVTRLEDGKLRLRCNTELLDDIIQEALRHLDRKSVTHCIRVQLEDDLILVKADARLIVQVIINIADNAIKYTQSDSEITISAVKRKDQIQIEIADNGPGIEDDVKEKVFEMFYSGANRVADSRRSLGLGLSLCKSIINAHGGTIQVLDNVPRGTKFTFTLPNGEVEIHE